MKHLNQRDVAVGKRQAYKMRKDTERKLQKVKKRISKSAGTNDKLIQKRKRQSGERKPKRLIDNQRQI
jgi:hypothetical protein